MAEGTLARILTALEGAEFEHGIIPSAAHGRLAPVCTEIDAELAEGARSPADGTPRDAELVGAAREWATRVERGEGLAGSDTRALAAVLRELADALQPVDVRRP
ncbi:hypothetical protein [Agromyces cerinus]|uniref:Uncharacterized protein n=1 Tax=Agromyces cerinus subsp. cerinus TaxID=232089 RepID=A0A1N6GSA0_9MICO|nr:hypothetical protein [Agromyces cerinus]SIO10389.1 hypothetical protein SAMN05443544_2827 [Agromyces cerinus subsp. cerinus]